MHFILVFAIAGNYTQSHVSNKLPVLAALLSTSLLMNTVRIPGQQLLHSFQRASAAVVINILQKNVCKNS
jgi:hypothetical protein